MNKNKRVKDAKLSLHLRNEDKLELKEAAQKEGQTLQDFILNPAIERARNLNINLKEQL